MLGEFCLCLVWPSLSRNLTGHSLPCPQSTEIDDCLLGDPLVVLFFVSLNGFLAIVNHAVRMGIKLK